VLAFIGVKVALAFQLKLANISLLVVASIDICFYRLLRGGHPPKKQVNHRSEERRTRKSPGRKTAENDESAGKTEPDGM
jgi:hypothetical protein